MISKIFKKNNSNKSLNNIIANRMILKQSILATYKIVNSFFWKSFYGPFFAFVFPIIFIAILGSFLGYSDLFGGSLAIASLSVSLTAMPQALFEFKRSSLFKRIGVSSMRPWLVLLIIGSFYFVVMLVASFWALAIGIAIFSSYWTVGKEIDTQLIGTQEFKILAPSLSNMLSNVNWGGFLWGLIMNVMIGIGLGLWLVSVSKSFVMILSIGVPLLIISQFLCAMVLPINMVRNIEFLWYFGYVVPFKPSTNLILESFNGILAAPTQNMPNLDNLTIQQTIIASSNIFDVSKPFMGSQYRNPENLIEMISTPEKIINLILPFVWTGFFAFLSLRWFKWSVR